MTTSTDRVVEFVQNTTFDALPDGIVTKVAPPIIDTIGVILAGGTDPVGDAILGYAEAVSSQRLREQPWLGAHPGVAPDLAALVSSTLAHALDFDDVLPGAGHPSSIVLSATLAAGAGSPISGQRLVEAYVVGVQVMQALSRAVGHRHYQKGWHTTSTIGGFAAVAAAAKALELSADETRMALGIVASMAAGMQRNFGTMTKPVHSGLAAQNGVAAALMARAGITGAEEIFDGVKGFFDIYGEGASRPEILASIDEPLAVIEPGMSLKKFACCFEVYRPMQAVLEIQREHAVPVSELDRLVCTAPPGTTGPLIDHAPRTGMEAKFSIEHSLAAAFVDRQVTMDTFSDRAITRDDLKEVMQRIEVIEDVRTRPDDPEGINASASSGGFVEVVIATRSGDRHLGIAHHAIGTPSQPLTADEIRTKFIECSDAGGVSSDVAGSVYEKLAGLDAIDDVWQVLQELSAAADRPAI